MTSNSVKLLFYALSRLFIQVIQAFFVLLAFSFIVVLICAGIYMGFSMILLVLEKYSLLSNFNIILNSPKSYLYILIISLLLAFISLSFFTTLRKKTSLWIGRIKNLNFLVKTKQVIKDNNYWANFYFKRAQRFRYADGVKKNPEYAIKLYQVSANLGHLQSQVCLSYLLPFYKLSANHKEEAFAWALKASELKHPAALFNLGIMYKNGLGTQVDYIKAFDAIDKAISNGFYKIEKSGEAYFQLGIMHKQGLGTEINYKKAIKWLTKAKNAHFRLADSALKETYLLNSECQHNKQDEKVTKSHQNKNKNWYSYYTSRINIENEQNNQPTRLLNCPSCEQSLYLPKRFPKGKVRCAKCHYKFRIKMDIHGNYQIFCLPDNHEKELNLPKSRNEARDVLSIMTHDSATQIKRAYKAKMRDYHPDRVNNLGVKLKKLAEHESKRINAAYVLLKAS
jgi:TPR repeat protein